MSILASRLPAIKFLAIFAALNYATTYLSKVTAKYNKFRACVNL